MLTNTERQQIVKEVNAGTYGIDEALDDIAAAQKGEEVRKALYAEALVLNREGHAGSTDMIARQQIANLQTSVNGQISTLRTEVGEDIDDLETALNSGLATQNGRIAAQNATIANVVASYNVEYGSTELWASTGETGALAAGTTVTLSEDVSHFDYIDIYSFCGNSNVLDTVPVDAKLQSSQGYALRWVNLSDPDSGSYKAYVRIVETRLHIIGTTLTIDHQVTYRNGEEVNISGAEITQSNRSTYMGEFGIMKIVGRKITANTEIEDVRIGADGTTYNSAGQAVRAQVQALESAIPAVDSTLSTQGAAADAKVAGDKVAELKSALTLKTEQDAMTYSIRASELELGRIDDSGNPVYHASRCRTKDFIPVSKGDTIIPIDCAMSLSYSTMIFYYDKTYTFLSHTEWLYFRSTITAPQIVQNDGYIKTIYSTADFAIYDGKVTISRTANTNADQIQALESKLRTDILPVPAANLRSGYWAFGPANSFKRAINRGANYKPIKVSKGDEAHFTYKNDLLVNIGLVAEDGSTIATKNARNNMPFKATQDGYFCFTFFTPDDTSTADLTVWDNAITIKRACKIGSVEDIRSSDLYNGYINASDGISNHQKRLVNWNPIHANKGDIIRINLPNIMMSVIEFDVSKTRLAETSQYITAQYVGGNYQNCGDYYVQHDDCWVMCTFAMSTGETEPDTFLPVDYDRIASIIHINSTESRNERTSDDTTVRFPKSARKGKKLLTDAVVHQGATFVDGKLWACNEVSGGADYIQVIDVDTGVIEKTITHDLGHCNCLDYCGETDTLITMDSTAYQTILLYPGVSGVTTSIAKADCISVALDTTVVDFAGTVCFGQDEREVFMFAGRGSNTPYNLYRGVLDYENGAYTGTISIDKVYKGIIRDNIDTYVTPGFSRYAQDSCYDGYFYLAYGTSGHNFLVIDLDDRENTYRVVGNYLHHEYKDDRTEYGVEPEGVCLHNGKIYCLSRQNTIHASYFNIFNR